MRTADIVINWGGEGEGDCEPRIEVIDDVSVCTRPTRELPLLELTCYVMACDLSRLDKR